MNQTIKSINYTTFKREIKDKKQIYTVLINPYFNLENHSAKTVHIVEGLDEITEVTYRGAKNKVALLVPYNEVGIKETLLPYYGVLQRLVRIQTPVISVFNTKGEKITQLND